MTRELMVKFYEHLVTRISIREALNRAQQDIRKHYPDPAAWGGFILIGK
jgi:CHAT domain-containing protein